MDDIEFWRIIEGAREYGARFDDTFEGRIEGLAAELRRLEPEQIEQFADAFYEKRDRAYTWNLWGAAYLLGGGCSNDGFMDFRNWLISMGRARFERALEDPDSLADVEFGPRKEQDSFFESYGYVQLEVYEELTGEELPLRHWTAPAEPLGEPWDDGDLKSWLPRLWRTARP